MVHNHQNYKRTPQGFEESGSTLHFFGTCSKTITRDVILICFLTTNFLNLKKKKKQSTPSSLLFQKYFRSTITSKTTFNAEDKV